MFRTCSSILTPSPRPARPRVGPRTTTLVVARHLDYDGWLALAVGGLPIIGATLGVELPPRLVRAVTLLVDGLPVLYETIIIYIYIYIYTHIHI